MRNLTNEEVEQVAGGVAPAVIGAMYIASHPTTIAVAKWGAMSFGAGVAATAGSRFYHYLEGLLLYQK